METDDDKTTMRKDKTVIIVFFGIDPILNVQKYEKFVNICCEC